LRKDHHDHENLKEKPLNEKNRIETKGSLFPLGRTVATPGALVALEESGESPSDFLGRHQSGDWGEVCAEDRAENELSLKEGFRLLSAYRTRKGTKIWLITEADRSATTILLPSEY
jgi:hypothetical protein